MPKADVLNLVQLLSNGMADPTITGVYYDETMFELAHEQWFTQGALVAASPTTNPSLARGQLEIDLTATGYVDLLALIYDNQELEEVSLRLLEAINPYWRQVQGKVTSYIEEDTTVKSLALYPVPSPAPNPFIPNYNGNALGADYPTYSLAAFFTYAPLEPLEPFYYLEFTTALRILAREFQRVSDHRDDDFSATAQGLRDLLKDLVARWP